MSVITWGHSGLLCRVKKGWDQEGREGECFCAVIPGDGQRWCVVEWDDERDPECFKMAGLQFKYEWETSWRNEP